MVILDFTYCPYFSFYQGEYTRIDVANKSYDYYSAGYRTGESWKHVLGGAW